LGVKPYLEETMSYLGYANLFYHLGRIMRGYLIAPPSHRSMLSDFYSGTVALLS